MTPTEKNNLDFTAIGQRLRIARTKKGLRITDAIELTGMSSGVISALEIGNRNPGLNSLVTFSRAYDVSLDELVFGTAPSPASGLENDATGEAGEAGSCDNNADAGGSSAEVERVENQSTGDTETDPYYRSLREILDGCDPAEKDFMLRLISTAHSEFAIVRNKMKV